MLNFIYQWLEKSMVNERTSFSTHEYAKILAQHKMRISTAQTLLQRNQYVRDYIHFRDDFLIADNYVYPIRDFKIAA